jgi:hypothetical protein
MIEGLKPLCSTDKNFISKLQPVRLDNAINRLMDDFDIQQLKEAETADDITKRHIGLKSDKDFPPHGQVKDIREKFGLSIVRRNTKGKAFRYPLPGIDPRAPTPRMRPFDFKQPCIDEMELTVTANVLVDSNLCDIFLSNFQNICISKNEKTKCLAEFFMGMLVAENFSSEVFASKLLETSRHFELESAGSEEACLGPVGIKCEEQGQGTGEERGRCGDTVTIPEKEVEQLKDAGGWQEKKVE